MSEEKKGDDVDDYSDGVERKIPMRPTGQAPKRGAVDPKEEKDASIKLGIEKVALAANTGMEWDELQKLWLWDDEPSYSQSVQDALDSRFRYCALMGNNMGLQFLYNKGAELDGKDTDGNTALHLAVTPQEKHIERQNPIIEYLMNAGADCDLLNNAGYSPKTHVAGVTSEKMVSIVRVLDVQRKPMQQEDQVEEYTEEQDS